MDKIKQGINPPSVHEIYFDDSENLAKGFRIGVVAGMIALTVSNIFISNDALVNFPRFL